MQLPNSAAITVIAAEGSQHDPSSVDKAKQAHLSGVQAQTGNGDLHSQLALGARTDTLVVKARLISRQALIVRLCGDERFSPQGSAPAALGRGISPSVLVPRRTRVGLKESPRNTSSVSGAPRERPTHPLLRRAARFGVAKP